MKQTTQIHSKSTQNNRPSDASLFSIFHKEYTMRNRRLSFFRRMMASLLMLLSLNVVSVFGQSVPGQIGNALPFDGQSEANIPHIGPFNSNDITLEAWVRVDQLTGGQQTVITKPGTASLSIDAQGGVGFRVTGVYRYDYVVFTGFGYGPTKYANANHSHAITSNPGLIVPGQWHYVAGVYTLGTGQITLLVDDTHKTETVSASRQVQTHFGKQNKTYPLKELVNNNNPLRIGLNLVGLIDEVRFWSGARSTGELVANRGFALNGNEGALAGLWHMDDSGSGDTTPPVIVLNGEAEMTLNEPYVELDAVATDPAFDLVVADAGPYANDGSYHIGETSVPVTITGNVGSNLGDYTVTYTATDAAGNTATVDRLVHVECFLYDWEQMPGSAVDIAFGGNGDLWMTGGIGFAGGYQVFRWEADNWVPVQAGAQRIGVAPNGIPWIVLNNGLILRKDSDPTSTAWYPVPDAGAGGAIDIGMGGPGNGEVWVVAEHTPGGDHAAFRWNPAASSWDATGGYTGKAIDVAPDGSAWMRLDDGRILAFHAGASDWTGMPGVDVVDVALGYDGSAWCVAGNGEVRRWNASSYGWEKVSGEGKAISVAPDGSVYVVRADGSIWKGQPFGSNP